MITIEQIDEFRKRTNSSYGDAKYFLEKNNGDVLEAIIDFERTKTGKFRNFNKKQQPEDIAKRFVEIFQKGFDLRLIVKDGDSVLFTVPIVLLIILIPLWPITVLFFIFLSAIGYKFSVQEIKGNSFDVNNFINNINAKMKQQYNAHKNPHHQPVQNNCTSDSDKEQKTRGEDIANTVFDNGNNHDISNEDDDEDEDYNEFTVE